MCPAGMMDEDKNFKGQAAKELEEEAGVIIEPSSLKELLTYASSGGGSDELIKVFYTEIEKSKSEMEEIKAKIYGLTEHGEIIRIHLVPLNIEKILSYSEVQDSKLICALFAYQNLVRKSLNFDRDETQL